jgi:hypothetical protein
VISTKSSISAPTTDSNDPFYAQKHHSEHNESNSFDSLHEDFKFLANTLYENSLKYYKGLKPWRTYLKYRKYRKNQNNLAQENYTYKLIMKGFNGLFQERVLSIITPQKFRTIFLIQKCFTAWRKHSNVSDKYNKIIKNHQKYVLTSKMFDKWKVYVYIQKVLRDKEKRRIQRKNHAKGN